MIPANFKPNLAATLTKPELIKFPVYCSPKIDGIRCVVFDGVAYSRSLKPIPNIHVQAFVKSNAEWLDSLDGELVVGSPTDPNCMQNSMAVMRIQGEPEFTFHVFDRIVAYFHGNTSFIARRSMIQALLDYRNHPRVVMVPQHLSYDLGALDTHELLFLNMGYEGMMIRDPDASYKFGRSTEREGGLVKVKRFTDAEAVIVGFEEEQHNANEATKNATGNTERSTAKAGLVGKGTLGALAVERDGVRFNIGTGFSASQRKEFWEARDSIMGRIVTFKFFDHGTVDAPRHPVFKSFRHVEDT
jgi:DNA ligase-1